MKHLLFFSLGVMLFASTQSMAQISGSAGGTTKFTLGVSIGGTMLKGDLAKSNFAPAGKINMDYNFTRHITAGVEFQGGQLSEGAKAGTEWFSAAGIKYTGNYFGTNLNARLEAGQFTDNINSNILHSLAGLYLGAGVGYVYSLAPSDINRGAGDLIGPESSGMFCIPLNIGFNLPIKKSETGVNKIMLNINYQYNSVFSDDLDSYNYPSIYNNKKDAYSLLTVGVRVNLGSTIWGE